MHFFTKFYRPRCYKTDRRNVCQMLPETQLLALRLEEVSQFVRNFVTLRYGSLAKALAGEVRWGSCVEFAKMRTQITIYIYNIRAR